MEWIKVRTSLFEHPKILKLARILKVRTPEALGLCVTLWSKAYGLTRNGDTGYAPEDLDYLVGRKGLSNALIDVGWATTNADGCMVLSNWSRYCGAQQERQENARLRKQRSRENHYKQMACHSDVTVTKCDMSQDVRAIERKINRYKKDNTVVLSKKEQSLLFPSSLESCLLSLPEDLQSCNRSSLERWFLYRCSVGWKTSNGVAIEDWIADLRLWLAKDNSSHVNEDDGAKKISAPPSAVFVPQTSVEVH